MKNCKKGFTLIEALLALTIVGIVAALIIPQFTDSINKKVSGITLGRAVNQIELGLQNIINAANENPNNNGSHVDTLSLITIDDILENGVQTPLIYGNTIFEDLTSFLGIQKLPDNIMSDYRTRAGSALNGFYTGTFYSFDKLQAYIIFFQPFEFGFNINYDKDSIFATVVIDTNGPARPNLRGRDLFLFGITNGGKLIPAGSQIAISSQFGALRSTPLAENGCPNVNGFSCTARVVEDGYKIEY